MSFEAPVSAYVYQIPQSEFHFDVEKVAQTYKTYHENHPGLTLVIGHPFEDKEFLGSILKEQQLIKQIFEKYGLDQYLNLYEPEQIHATIIELASQHDESQIEQQTLSEHELAVSTKGVDINVNFAAEWINKTEPFDVELGVGVLSEEHKDQAVRITPNGQIVMKGRAKDRDLIAKIRGEFEDQSSIVHKYGRTDDEFFFVIGYLTPSHDLNSPLFIKELLSHMEARREVIQLSMKVTELSVILYQQRTLTPSKCLKQWDFQLNQEPKISNLFQEVIKENKIIMKKKNRQEEVVLDFGDVLVKKSGIGQFEDGLGVFANRDFKEGEIVVKFNLKTLTQEEYTNLPEYERTNFCHKRNEIIYFYPDPARHVNRSKNPNVLSDIEKEADIALRDIKKGEELSISESSVEDY